MQESEENNLWKLPKELLIKIILNINDFDKISFTECEKIKKKLDKCMKKKKITAIREGFFSRLKQVGKLEENTSNQLKEFLSHVSVYKDLDDTFIYKGKDIYDSYLFSVWGITIRAAWDDGIRLDIQGDSKLKSLNNQAIFIIDLFKDKKFHKAYNNFFHGNTENEYFKF